MRTFLPIKCIPPIEIIFDLLTPIALAFWIMGDGESHHSGLRLCTNSFTLIDVVKLINILQVKYQLDCTLYIKVNKYPIIYIRGCIADAAGCILECIPKFNTTSTINCFTLYA